MDEDYSISDDQLKLCLYITAELRKSPAASVFNEPVDPKKQSIPDYYKKIRNPQDLGTIYGRLQRKEYKSVGQWEKDINLIWMNAETYNGKDSYIAFMANHMKKKLERLKKPLDRRNISGWTKNIYQLREKFDSMLASCPPSLQLIAPRDLNSASAIFHSSFTYQNISDLMKVSEMIKTQNNIDQVSEIIQKNNTQFEANLTDNVDDIK